MTSLTRQHERNITRLHAEHAAIQAEQAELQGQHRALALEALLHALAVLQRAQSFVQSRTVQPMSAQLDAAQAEVAVQAQVPTGGLAFPQRLGDACPGRRVPSDAVSAREGSDDEARGAARAPGWPCRPARCGLRSLRSRPTPRVAGVYKRRSAALQQALSERWERNARLPPLTRCMYPLGLAALSAYWVGLAMLVHLCVGRARRRAAHSAAETHRKEGGTRSAKEDGGGGEAGTRTVGSARAATESGCGGGTRRVVRGVGRDLLDGRMQRIETAVWSAAARKRRAASEEYEGERAREPLRLATKLTRLRRLAGAAARSSRRTRPTALRPPSLGSLV